MIVRKPLLCLAFLGLALTALSQIPKGTIMTGGNVDFEFHNNSSASLKYNTAAFDFSPQIGGFAGKNLVLGVTPTLGYTFSKGYVYDTIAYFNSQTNAGIGPFVRYYVKLVPKVYFFCHVSPSVLVVWNSYSSNPNAAITKYIAGSWILGGGITYLVTPSVGIEASLFYKGRSYQSSQYINGNLVGKKGDKYIENGMVLNVGVQVYIGPKTKRPADVKK
jgi:hypothetical protein